MKTPKVKKKTYANVAAQHKARKKARKKSTFMNDVRGGTSKPVAATPEGTAQLAKDTPMDERAAKQAAHALAKFEKQRNQDLIGHQLKFGVGKNSIPALVVVAVGAKSCEALRIAMKNADDALNALLGIPPQ